jgi:DNA-binding CsgD family transcriptional regulator
VRQALDVARRLRSAGETGRLLERALDWLADGVALVRIDGAVVYANEKMQAIARRGDGIRLGRSAIEFDAAEARERFDVAVGAVGRLKDGDVRATAVDFTAARSADAPPYLVSVRPLVESPRHGSEHQAVAVVFVRDPSARHAAAIGTLREAFGLTEAEASLAQALQAGISLASYAQARALSLNTVYTHLRRLREKTGCNRMVALMRKLNDLQVTLRLG